MTKDPAFLFYPGDYLRDTQCLSEKTQVSYDRIMCEHMRNTCISHQQLKFFTKRLDADEKEELLMVLVESNEGYSITWVVDSIEKRRAYSDSRRRNREKPNKDKDLKGKKDMKTYDNHMEDESEDENKNVIEIEEPPFFEDFWNLYDRKRDKDKSKKKWLSLKQDQRVDIMFHIIEYVKSTPDKNYRKDPMTYLNGKCWEDEIMIKNKNGSEKVDHEALQAELRAAGYGTQTS